MGLDEVEPVSQPASARFNLAGSNLRIKVNPTQVGESLCFPAFHTEIRKYLSLAVHKMSRDASLQPHSSV